MPHQLPWKCISESLLELIIQHECSAGSRKPDPAWQGFADSSAVRHHTQINKQKRDNCFCFTGGICIFLRSNTEPKSHQFFKHGRETFVAKLVLPHLILHRSSKRPSSSCGRSRAMAVSAYMLMIRCPARSAVSRTNSFSSARACTQPQKGLRKLNLPARYTQATGGKQTSVFSLHHKNRMNYRVVNAQRLLKK